MPGWQQRNTGESGEQLNVHHIVIDAWWKIKGGDRQNTSDPEQCIYLKCGVGYIRRSTDGGTTWEDITPVQDSAADTALAKWSDSPAPTVTDLTYTKLHDSIHNNGTFYTIATWQNGSSEWRSWLLKTTDDGAHYTWKPLTAVTEDDDGYIYPLLMKAWYGYNIHLLSSHFKVESGQGTAVGEADGSYLEMKHYESGSPPGEKSNYRVEVCFDFGAEITGSKTIQIRGFKSGTLTNYFSAGRYTSDSDEWDTLYSTGDTTGWDTIGSTIAWLGSECPTAVDWYTVGTADSDENFRYLSLENVVRTGVWGAGSQWFLDTVRVQADVDQPQTRALGLEVDSEDSSRVYVTCWNSADGLQLWTFNASQERQRIYDLGAATAAQVAAKTYFADVFSPHRPDLAGWGDRCYLYGRMAGSVKHLGLTTDAGVTLNDAGYAGWADAARVACLFGGEHINTSTLYAALVNNPGNELWRQVGANWSLVTSLPAEPKAMYMHPSAAQDGAVCAILGESVYFASDADSYASWSLLENQPPPITSGGTIIWIA